MSNWLTKFSTYSARKSTVVGVKKSRDHFIDGLNASKKNLEKECNFYPYSTVSNLSHLDNLLSDSNLSSEDVLSSTTVSDIGGADGDIAFYCEYLGAEKVNLIDNPPTNFNNLIGAVKLKEALGSKINIIEADLDSIRGWDRVEPVETTVFLGILYHLKNPYLALSNLSQRSKYLLLSTKVFDEFNGQNYSSISMAYSYDSMECNNDSSNWWCFTDECLKRMIDRSGWEIIAYKRFGCKNNANPVDNQKDGRAFAYLKSKME